MTGSADYVQLEFWNLRKEKPLIQLDLNEPVLGVRMTDEYFLIVLEDRVICMEYIKSMDDFSTSPALVRDLFITTRNSYALCCISRDVVVLPGLTAGQVQILGLRDKSKRVIPAHQSALRQLTLSRDGELFATASEQVRQKVSPMNPTRLTSRRAL